MHEITPCHLPIIRYRVRRCQFINPTVSASVSRQTHRLAPYDRSGQVRFCTESAALWEQCEGGYGIYFPDVDEDITTKKVSARRSRPSFTVARNNKLGNGCGGSSAGIQDRFSAGANRNQPEAAYVFMPAPAYLIKAKSG